MIKFVNVFKNYHSKKEDVVALNSISLEFPKTGMVFIVGKSGSGKSTLLNVLGGLDTVSKGNIFIGNKDLTKFSSKQMDRYRNNFVGFVFQEFNLLEEFNVFDNIAMSFSLNHKVVDKRAVLSILDKVGLKGYESRRINELSGGEKQRVAIARALLSKSPLILCDEPTGSLDSVTSTQIFDLLKTVSQDNLVVIVSHDVESARKYADRIVTLHDGSIISDSNPQVVQEVEEYTFHKSHLPLNKIFKLALTSLRHKKIRLALTIILLSLSLFFLAMSNVLTSFNIEQSHAETITSLNSNRLLITRNLSKNMAGEYVRDSFGEPYYFTENDLVYLSSIISNYNKLYSFQEDNEKIIFPLLYDKLMNDDLPIYYSFNRYNPLFSEVTDDFRFTNILGTLPINDNDIVIHSYLADLMIYHGVSAVEIVDEKEKTVSYHPSSYDDILKDKKLLKIGSMRLSVSGIIVDDTSEYEILKTKMAKNNLDSTGPSFLGFQFDKNTSFRSKFVFEITKPGSVLYTKSGFIDKVSLKDATSFDMNRYHVDIKVDDKEFAFKYGGSKLNKINDSIMIYNGKETVKVEKLDEAQIVVDKAYLDLISDNKFSKEWKIYLEDYQRSLEQGTGSYISSEELYLSYVKEFLKDKSIIGKAISLEIGTMAQYLADLPEDALSSSVEGVIVGIELSNSDSSIYLASSIIDPYLSPRKDLVMLEVLESDQEKIQAYLTMFPYKTGKYLSNALYSEIVSELGGLLNTVQVVAFYSSLVFAVFSILLLVNYILTSVMIRKKEIGILRALGARKVDILKIFFTESCMIGLMAAIVSLMSAYFVTVYLNHFISNILYFDISFIRFTVVPIFLIILGVVIFTFMASLGALRRISMMRPIDIINNK